MTDTITRRHRHYEAATFCFRCGGPVTAKQYCTSCGISWERLYTNQCPTSGPGNTWCHLFAPMHSLVPPRGDGNLVVIATGFADCEFCSAPHLYRWTPSGLELTDADGRRIVLQLEEVNSL